MKQKTSLQQKMNNKGFSLIELLMAIALLAIIIIPVLNSFIASARINRDSRRVMIATDVAQTIMEGFSDKDFSDIKSSFGLLGTVDLSGNKAFSTISGNLYNSKDHYVYCAFSDISSISINTITFQTNTISTASLVSGNGVDICTAYCKTATNTAYMEASMRPTFGTTGLVGFSDGDGNGILLCYSNLFKDGYYYDVVVSILPAALTGSETYYTYNIKICVFETDGNVNNVTTRGDKLLMTMDGGIRK